MGLTILLVDDDQILTEKTKKFIKLGQSWHWYGVYCKQYP